MSKKYLIAVAVLMALSMTACKGKLTDTSTIDSIKVSAESEVTSSEPVSSLPEVTSSEVVSSTVASSEVSSKVESKSTDKKVASKATTKSSAVTKKPASTTSSKPKTKAPVNDLDALSKSGPKHGGSATSNKGGVTLDANGGTCSMKTYTGNKNADPVLALPNAKRSSYMFDGWWTDKVGGNQPYNFSKVNTLYAHWIKEWGWCIKNRNTSELSGEDKTNADKVISILSQTSDLCSNDYDKVKSIHDYIINNVTYGEAYGDQSWESALIGGRSVCSGYSLAFGLLCEYAGVSQDGIICSTSAGDHAINKVKIDGVWKYVDVTWDDHDNGSVVYDYFLITEDEMRKDHTW